MARAQKGTENAETHSGGMLAGAAKAIGGFAGKVASAVGAGHSVHASAEGAPTPRKGKLEKKNKSRLPRKLKKEMKKKTAAATQSADSTF